MDGTIRYLNILHKRLVSITTQSTDISASQIIGRHILHHNIFQSSILYIAKETYIIRPIGKSEIADIKVSSIKNSTEWNCVTANRCPRLTTQVDMGTHAEGFTHTQSRHINKKWICCRSMIGRIGSIIIKDFTRIDTVTEISQFSSILDNKSIHFESEVNLFINSVTLEGTNRGDTRGSNMCTAIRNS